MLNFSLFKHCLKHLGCKLGNLGKTPSLKLLAAGLLFSQTLSAQTAFPSFSNFSFAGYGTIGYAWLNDDDAEYRTGEGESGATNEGSFAVDTRLALQLDGTFNSFLSGSAQVIARQNEEGDPGAELEWGFLRLQPGERIVVRVGRMSLPTFSLSDFREVGYANVLLRPPEDVYSQVPLRRLNGVDVTVESLVMGTLVTFQVVGGVAREKIFNDLEPDAKQILGLSTWIERGPFKARANFTTAQIDVDSRSATIDTLRQGIDGTLAQAPELGAFLNPVRAELSGDYKDLTFASFGVSADFDSYFVDLEFARRRINNWVVDVDSWSLVAGVNIGRYSPYAFVSSNRDAQPDRRVSLPDSPQLDPLEAAINNLYAPRSQNTAGVGLRYDLSEKIALKSQFEYISREDIGISFRRLSDDGTDNGDDVVLASFVVDFVF